MAKPYQENKNARMWLWIGVSLIGTIILVLWLWATSISLSAFDWQKSPEKKLIENSQNDWNELFNNEKTKAKNEQTKLQIKNILNTIISEAKNTSTASSTVLISTSSPANNNSSTIPTSSKDTQSARQQIN